MSWDDKKIEILKNEWGKGKTASQIAELIGVLVEMLLLEKRID